MIFHFFKDGSHLPSWDLFGCVFLSLVNIAAYLGDLIAPKPQFLGVNRCFPAKRTVTGISGQ